MIDKKEELKRVIDDAKSEYDRIVKEEEAELQRQEEMEAIRAENRKRQAELEVKEKQRKAEMEEAVRSGKLTLGDPHLSEHERHEVRQILQRMEEERNEAARKATEKSPFEKLLEKHERAKKLLEETPSGNYDFHEVVKWVLREMGGVIDGLLELQKPEQSGKSKK